MILDFKIADYMVSSLHQHLKLISQVSDLVTPYSTTTVKISSKYTSLKTTQKEAKMGRLAGKVAIITGAGAGIGRSAAILFAREGAKVVVVDWNARDGEETVSMVKEFGGECVFVKADVARAEDVKGMVKMTINTYGKLDILFNNAGIVGAWVETADYPEETWEQVIAVNLKGVFLGMKYAIPEMLKRGGGSIVNTASQAGERGQPNIAAYSASKGGVLALSRATAIEYAAKNIRINSINPGIITTPMVMNVMEKNAKARKQFLSVVPQGRFGKPEEVAQAALFLASDASSHITGHALVVDGGMEADGHIRT
jgi:NAD(P)-dependent dehydrogenase (short-subunit alcohol dehydrogenase family)